MISALSILAGCEFTAETPPAVTQAVAAQASPFPAPPGVAWTKPVTAALFGPVSSGAVIQTIAGTGEYGAGGDGGPAAVALLAGPTGIAVDGRGNVYVADATLGVIRRIDSEGRITRIAGSARRADSGDGGPALAAGLTDPSWLLVDGSGALLIATLDRIRRVGGDGVIQTVAGNGSAGFAGDGGQAAAAVFNGNAGMAMDAAGNVYIADRGNGRVRRIDPTGVITTIAGNGEERSAGDGGPAALAALNRPVDVAAGPDGSLYVAELEGHRIRRIDPQGVITTIAGTGTPGFSGDGGPAINATLNSPRAIEIDSAGNLYVADWRNRVIRRVAPDGIITTTAGIASVGTIREGFSAFAAALAPPLDVALGPDGKLYLILQGARKIHVIQAAQPSAEQAACAGVPRSVSLRPPPKQDPVAVTLAGQAGTGFGGDGGPAADALFLIPQSFAIFHDGRVFVADTGNHRIRMISPGGLVETLVGTGEPGYGGDGGKATLAQVSAPKALALDGQGNLYFSDSGNFRIRRVDICGIVETIAGTGRPGSSGDGGPAIVAEIRDPSGLALDGQGNLFVADPASNVVRVVGPDGNIRTFAGTGQAASGPDGGMASTTPLDGPTDVALASDGTVYIAEQRAGKVRAVDPVGLIRTVAGPGAPDAKLEGPAAEVRIVDPTALLLDRDGNLYVAQLTSGLVSVLATDGSVRTIAGNPAGTGVSGDPATEVAIPAPLDIDLDGGGNLYVLESAGIIWQVGTGDGKVIPAEG